MQHEWLWGVFGRSLWPMRKQCAFKASRAERCNTRG